MEYGEQRLLLHFINEEVEVKHVGKWRNPLTAHKQGCHINKTRSTICDSNPSYPACPWIPVLLGYIKHQLPWYPFRLEGDSNLWVSGRIQRITNSWQGLCQGRQTDTRAQWVDIITHSETHMWILMLALSPSCWLWASHCDLRTTVLSQRIESNIGTEGVALPQRSGAPWLQVGQRVPHLQETLGIPSELPWE